MKIMTITRRAILFTLAIIIVAMPGSRAAIATPLLPAGAAAQPNIAINAYFATSKTQHGRTVQGVVALDIPSGYHINSNRPIAKYLIATSVKLDPRDGVRVGSVRYPRALLRNFSFSDQKLSVFEGRVLMRFSVTIPANFPNGKLELKGKVKYQSCSDKECYAPTTRDVSLWIDVVG